MDPSKINQDGLADSFDRNSSDDVPLATHKDLNDSSGGWGLKLNSNRDGIDWGALYPSLPTDPATDALDKAIEKPYHLDEK